MNSNITKRSWRKRSIFLGFVVLAISMGFLYIVNAKPVYTCTSKIFVQQSGSGSMDEAEHAVNPAQNFLQTQAALMNSTPIVRSALEQLDVSKMKFFSDIEDKIAYLKENIQASVGEKDDIISISLDSPHPAEAAHIVNGVVDAYVAFISKHTMTSSREVLAILQNEKDRVNEDLINKLKTLTDFKNENEALALEYKDSNIILERLADLSKAVTEAEIRTIEAKTKYDIIDKLASDPVKIREFIRSEHTSIRFISFEMEHLRLHKELDLDSLYRELANLNSQVADSHQLVTEKEAEIARIEKQLADLDHKFVETQLAVAMQQYHLAQQREKEIAESFIEQKEKAIIVNRQMAQLSLLQSEYDQSRRNLDILGHRIRELDVTDDVGRIDVTILEIAKPADKPSAPQKARVLALALVISFMSGGGLSFLKGLENQKDAA